MNLSIGQASYNDMNCQRKNNPNFKMAVKIDPSAMKVMKNQTLKLSSKAPKKNPAGSAYEKFWTKLNDSISRQEENPVNIIIRKTKMRNGLTAEVVDSQAATAVKNQKYSQSLLSKNGSLKFLDKAEKTANKINDTNIRLGKLTEATKNDYKAGYNSELIENSTVN